MKSISLYLTLFATLAVTLHAQKNINNTTYSSGTTVIIDSYNEISTGGGVIVESGAWVLLDANKKITLGPGFHAQRGAFFNARVPDWDAFVLGLISGNNQTTAAGTLNAQPFEIAVWAGCPLMNVPITLTVEQGGGKLVTNAATPAIGSSQVTVTTDVDGTIRVYYRQPAAGGVISIIRADIGTQEALTIYTYSDPLTTGTGVSSPTNFGGGAAGKNGITLSWTPGYGTSVRYELERKKGNDTYAKIADIQSGATGYGDSGLLPGTSYKYRIKTIAADGTITYSNEITLTTEMDWPPLSGVGTIIRLKDNTYWGVNASTWQIAPVAQP